MNQDSRSLVQSWCPAPCQWRGECALGPWGTVLVSHSVSQKSRGASGSKGDQRGGVM